MIITADSVRRGLYRKSFFKFFQAFWSEIVAEPLIVNWHIEYLCYELQLVVERIFNDYPKEYDLIINISPGSSKSTIFSQLLPAYCWTNMPSFRSINGSYAYDLALRDAVACRDVISSENYRRLWPYLSLREDRNTMGLFVNNYMGGRLSVSVGSKVTGFHGHLLGIDDPLDPEQSYSEPELKKASRWMTQTLPSRGIKKSDTPMILVMQRLHQADPTGERLAKGGRLKQICIPSELIYDRQGQLAVNVSPPNLIKKYKRDKTGYPNPVMDPERLNGRHLTEFRNILGEYGYAGQYLQDPVPLSGAMFDLTKIKIEEAAPRMVRLVRAWDKAATKDAGAYSCGTLIGVDKFGDYWVLDVQRGRWTAGDRENVIKQTAQLDSKGAYAQIIGTRPGPVHVEIVIEEEGGSGGKESAEASIRRLAGFHTATQRPVQKKEVRAFNFASQMAIQDRVHVLNRDWTREWIEEFRFFPNSKYKDQVDSGSMAFNRLNKPARRVGAVPLGAMR